MENSNLADRYFYAKQRLDTAEAEVEELRDEIIATKKAAIVGKEARVSVEAKDFHRFSVAKAKDILSPVQIKACTTQTEGFVVRVKKLAVRQREKSDLFEAPVAQE